MARTARLTIPGLPHHVTQRGNRRQKTFFGADDYRTYLDLAGTWCTRHAVDIWAYYLMPNHVHLIAVPATETALSAAMSEVHRRYTRHVNFRMGWTGHLWQARFASFVMDDRHLFACARYVELNPVHAGLCKQPEDWRWSSTRAHLSGDDTGLCRVQPLLDRFPDWRAYLDSDVYADETKKVRDHDGGNWPLGSDVFLTQLEARTERRLRLGRPGRPAGTKLN